MERADREKSNRRKPDMGLDVVPRNVEQETPIVESGKSEEESNMAAPTPVGKDIDQDQNEGEEEESDVSATQEVLELIVQLFEQRTGDGNAKNTSTQSKHENRWEL